jgi:hypothetical protein
LGLPAKKPSQASARRHKKGQTMRSPVRTATKSPRPSSPRPQQQQPPPPPPWRLWFVGLLCAFAVVIAIERGGGAALDADPILNEPIGPESNPQLRRRKKPRVSLTKQAKNYLTKHARLYRLGPAPQERRRGERGARGKGARPRDQAALRLARVPRNGARVPAPAGRALCGNQPAS